MRSFEGLVKYNKTPGVSKCIRHIQTHCKEETFFLNTGMVSMSVFIQFCPCKIEPAPDFQAKKPGVANIGFGDQKNRVNFSCFPIWFFSIG